MVEGKSFHMSQRIEHILILEYSIKDQPESGRQPACVCVGASVPSIEIMELSIGEDI